MAKDLINPSEFENTFEVVIHEVTHVLGFSKYLYKYFLDPNNNYRSFGTVNESKIFKLDGATSKPMFLGAKVTEYARSYYGCPTLSGMRLED